MAFVDFAAIKEAVPIQKVCEWLGIKLKPSGNQYRASCPIHNGEDPRGFVITPSKGLFFCFGGCGGGDVIELVAKMKDLDHKSAASLIAEHFGLSKKETPKREPIEDGMSPLDYLQHEHDAVVAVGFDTEVAKALGVGYAPKGMMRGTVAVPIRNQDGVLVGYIGITEAKLPPSFTKNVVVLKQPA